MKSLIFLLTLVPFLVDAQSKVNFGRIDDDILQEDLKIEADQLRTYIYDNIPDTFRNRIKDRVAYRFADESAFLSSRILNSGSIYNGWQEADVYINDILRKVLPSELKDEPYLRAYLLKDGGHNAFMTPSGQVFINIGVFDQIESENCLAAILAHEAAHYVCRHSVDGFVKALKGEFKPGFLFKNEGAASKFSIENELNADSLAITYMVNAGYNTKGLLEAFNIGRRLEENELLQQKYVWDAIETTHPNSEKRIGAFKNIDSLISKQSDEDKQYLVSRARFEKIKEASKAETLKYLLDDFEYHDCLEKAFKYHLFDPYNPTYIYYAMEAIRRSCYLDLDRWKKKFIVNRYWEVIETEEGKEKVEINTHFFDKFRPELLGLEESSYEKIEAKFYWEDQVKFTTNAEAYQFFAQIGELLEEPECLLSYALRFSTDTLERDNYLNQYLANEEIVHRNFAETLLANKITTSLPDQKLTVFDNFFTIIRQGKDAILVWDGFNEKQNKLSTLIGGVISSFSNRNFIYLADLKKNHLNDYMALLELERFASGFLFTKNENTELHVLDPAYWELLNKFEVNEIEFLNCLYRDVVRTNNSKEGYSSVANSNCEDFLSLERKTGRHMNIFLTSLQIKESDIMKTRYYDGEDGLGFKKSGYDQIVELMEEKLINLDERSDE